MPPVGTRWPLTINTNIKNPTWVHAQSTRSVLSRLHCVQVWRRSVWTAWYSKRSFLNPWCNTTSVCCSNTAGSSCPDRAERGRATSLPGWPSTWWTEAPARSPTASWSLSTCTASHARWQKEDDSYDAVHQRVILIPRHPRFSLFFPFFFLSTGSAALSFQPGQSNRSGKQHVGNTACRYSGWYSRACFHQRTGQWCSHVQISQMVSSTCTDRVFMWWLTWP